jgi:hypothetical protein
MLKRSMSLRVTREDHFIRLFLSAYERGSWANAALTKPDAIERTSPAVDQIATRSDGTILALEHTIIEPFVGEKEDFAAFEQAAFRRIEQDESLLVPGYCVEVFVPVGTVRHEPPAARNAIVQSVHDWIKAQRLALPKGTSAHRCVITSVEPDTGYIL